MVADRPRVSVIVLNWNGERFLEECLQSLERQDAEGIEVLVADNGSTDRSESIVSKTKARWVPLGMNHGFAKGNNLGAESACGDFLVFVNNDMRFAPDFVRRLVEPMVADPEIFATDARQRDWDDERDLHMATFVRRMPLAGRWRGRPLPLLDFAQRHAAEAVVVAQACAGNMAVRREMFSTLAGFDPRLPAGWEDTEICWRSALMGWRTVYVPGALCWHHVGGSSESSAGAQIRLRGTIGGKLLFSTKHLPIEHALLVCLLEAVGPVRELAALRPGRALTRARTVLSFAVLLPALLNERRELYRRLAGTPRGHLEAMLEIAKA
jgi:GT2 family glycosyltransferase